MDFKDNIGKLVTELGLGTVDESKIALAANDLQNILMAMETLIGRNQAVTDAFARGARFAVNTMMDSNRSYFGELVRHGMIMTHTGPSDETELRAKIADNMEQRAKELYMLDTGPGSSPDVFSTIVEYAAHVRRGLL